MIAYTEIINKAVEHNPMIKVDYNSGLSAELTNKLIDYFKKEDALGLLKDILSDEVYQKAEHDLDQIFFAIYPEFEAESLQIQMARNPAHVARHQRFRELMQKKSITPEEDQEIHDYFTGLFNEPESSTSSHTPDWFDWLHLGWIRDVALHCRDAVLRQRS